MDHERDTRSEDNKEWKIAITMYYTGGTDLATGMGDDLYSINVWDGNTPLDFRRWGKGKGGKSQLFPEMLS
jgi:hypothetical protein